MGPECSAPAWMEFQITRVVDGLIVNTYIYIYVYICIYIYIFAPECVMGDISRQFAGLFLSTVRIVPLKKN